MSKLITLRVQDELYAAIMAEAEKAGRKQTKEVRDVLMRSYRRKGYAIPDMPTPGGDRKKRKTC